MGQCGNEAISQCANRQWAMGENVLSKKYLLTYD